MPEPHPDTYRCAWCLAHYVVPSLARQCETAHEALTTPDEEQP